jgi:hypothetical protein
MAEDKKTAEQVAEENEALKLKIALKQNEKLLAEVAKMETPQKVEDTIESSKDNSINEVNTQEKFADDVLKELEKMDEANKK